jgi:CBS domain containing-hemolysin-like protein
MASSARALHATVYLVYPFARALSGAGQLVRDILNLPSPRNWMLVSRRAVYAHLAAGAEQGTLSVPQQRLAENIMQAGSMPAMRAATSVQDSPVFPRAGELETPRLLVYSGHRDHVVGVVHVVQAWGVKAEELLSRLMRAPVWLDEKVSVLQALVALKRAGQTVAILAAPVGPDKRTGVDALGITQTIDWRARGIVTVEQLLKHLVAFSRRPPAGGITSSVDARPRGDTTKVRLPKL